jgi:hypothetical protein
MPGAARAQARQIKPDEFSPAAPVAVEVHARPIPAFDPRDRSHVRFGSLEYRSGLVLTSPFAGFGGLSGWRLDAFPAPCSAAAAPRRKIRRVAQWFWRR